MEQYEKDPRGGKRRRLRATALLPGVVLVLLAVALILLPVYGPQGGRDIEQTEPLPAGESTPSLTEEKQHTAEERDPGYTEEETSFLRDGKRIWGKLLLPRGQAPFPLVILAHGFNGNCDKVESYARAFAESGIAACVFDFIGGGEGSRSEGELRNMSVLTEAADLNAVLDSLRGREEFDPERIFLLGRSQGGFVTTLAAEERPGDIRAMVLLFPGFVISDSMRELAGEADEIPESTELMGATIGRIYLEDAMSVDIYEKMGDYPGDVLIFHGTADSIVPISYSERAATAFPSAELVTVEGAVHGFTGEDDEMVTRAAVDFVKAHLDA